jgi:outer membrane protein OmpA-like peptidoglycan-associated protein
MVIILVLIGVSTQLKSQNLVPDSSFESVHRLPTKKENSLTCTKDWMSPTEGASDYYHNDSKRHTGVPRNVFGRQKPHTGNAYAGICVRTNFIEYVQTKLTDTLIKDQEYLVEFYVCKAERSIGSVKEFGVLFTPKMTWGLTNKGILASPQIEFLKPSGYRKKDTWMKFSAIYKANGDEAAFILGPFKNSNSKRFRGFAHYYIDDVSIYPLNERADTAIQPIEPEIQEEEFLPSTGRTIRLGNVFFSTNESSLLPNSYKELDQLVGYLKEEPNANIHISGHTDNTGNEEHNFALSEARAEAVANYLSSKNISETRISFSGHGSEMPIASNDTEEGKQQNRRVEFVIDFKN